MITARKTVEDIVRTIVAEVLDENYEEMVKILDEIPHESRGKIINTNGHCGETAAHIAIYKDDEYMLRILIDHGAHPHAQNVTLAGDTLLHTAAKLGKLKFLQMLYETTLCNLQITNKQGKTPLDMSRLTFDADKDYVDLRLFKNYVAMSEDAWLDFISHEDSQYSEDTSYPSGCTNSQFSSFKRQWDLNAPFDAVQSMPSMMSSQEDDEYMEIVDGRTLCEAFLLEKIAEDEQMRIEHLTSDTTEWMVARERHRRIVTGTDASHHITMHAHMTYREKEGEMIVSQFDRDWFDRYHIGVNTVSRSLFADDVVANASRIASKHVAQRMTNHYKSK